MSQRKRKSKQHDIGWRTKMWLALGTIALSALVYLFQSETQKPGNIRVPSRFLSMGIDVSHHQGEIDWKALMVTSGYDSIVRFVYSKATEGGDFIDRQYQRNRKELNELGVLNGAYHFYRTTATGSQQANHFLSIYKKRDIDLVPVLDVELEITYSPQILAEIENWLKTVEVKTGVQPIIYCPYQLYVDVLNPRFPNYAFWLAGYSKKESDFNQENVILWQFTDQGVLPGISEKVDLNFSKLIPKAS